MFQVIKWRSDGFESRGVFVEVMPGEYEGLLAALIAADKAQGEALERRERVEGKCVMFDAVRVSDGVVDNASLHAHWAAEEAHRVVHCAPQPDWIG